MLEAMAVLTCFMSMNSGLDSRDLHFQYATEAFVREANPRLTPPVEVVDVLAMAGDNEYHCRELASLRLRKIEPRWLFWGLQSRDLEVRVRCNTALRASTRCGACSGSGYCQFDPKDDSGWKCSKCTKWSGSHRKGEDNDAECMICGGTGFAWNHTVFDLPESGK